MNNDYKLESVPGRTMSNARVQRKKSKLISIRVETEILNRLQELARKKQKRYQTLLKEFVMERLVEEENKAFLIKTARL
jgi:predicted DNA-binding protein